MSIIHVLSGGLGYPSELAAFNYFFTLTAEYAATAGVIFTAIGAIWGLRKVIKLLNRS